MRKRIPARLGDLDRHMARIGRICPAAVCIVPPGDHESEQVCSGIKDKVTSVFAIRLINGGGPVKATVKVSRIRRPSDVEIDVELGLVSSVRESGAVASPIGVRAIVDRVITASRRAHTRGLSESQSRVPVPGSGWDPACGSATVRVPGWAAGYGAVAAGAAIKPAVRIIFEPVEVGSRGRRGP